MALRITNSLTRTKEDFVPLVPGHVGMYVCGITPYDFCHVGHARVYVAFDVIVRWLRRSYQVTYVRNFTDVDDKIIQRAREHGEEPTALASRFCDAFHDDMARLGVVRADIEPRVTTHMAEIIDFVVDLERRGFAYRVPSSSTVEGAGFDVYYRVNRFADYTRLAHKSFEDLQAGARIAVDERKEDPLDFALWKSAKPGEPFWDSPFGKGRPGWHIECSAMSEKHLGVTFDIHGGGKDLLFPHHTNEVAQSEARHDGAPMARVWLHNGFVSVEVADDAPSSGEHVEEIVDEQGRVVRVQKMSKSLGNFFTIRDVFARFTAESLRYLLASTHYRAPIAFGPRLMEEAERRVQYIYETKSRMIGALAKSVDNVEDGPTLADVFGRPDVPFQPWAELGAALDDDFNVARAIVAWNDVMKVANLLVAGREKEMCGQKLKPGARVRLLREASGLFERMAAVFGVGEKEPQAFLVEQRALRLRTRGIDEAAVQQLLDERAACRARKDFTAADAARDALLRLGIEVRDTPDGVEWNVV